MYEHVFCEQAAFDASRHAEPTSAHPTRAAPAAHHPKYPPHPTRPPPSHHGRIPPTDAMNAVFSGHLPIYMTLLLTMLFGRQHGAPDETLNPPTDDGDAYSPNDEAATTPP